MKAKTLSISLDTRQLANMLLLATIAVLIPHMAMAILAPSANSIVGTFICNIADNFTGNAGRGIATIGISVIGTIALLGRITWTQALVVGVGCSILFGAPYLMVTLGQAQGICFQ